MRGRLRVIRGSMILAILALSLQILPAMAHDDNLNRGVLDPDDRLQGKSYSGWSNAWWQWAFSLPVVAGKEDQNPFFVYDTAHDSHCGAGQSGPVWFLAGAIGVNGSILPQQVFRNCTIPKGKAIFFPLVNFEDDIPTDPLGATNLKGIRATIARFLGGVDLNSLSTTLDGVAIKRLPKYRAGADGAPFSFTLPDDNLYKYFGLPGFDSRTTVAPAVSGGYYLMFFPLKPGKHTLHFMAKFSDPLFSVDIDVTYYLTIKD